MVRCPWAETDDLYRKYHDEEWGVPVHDDRTHFEFLVLEAAQAGLSWLTILRKRENYRRAYHRFDPVRVSKFGDPEFRRLLEDPGIVRNRKKIEASIHNARRFIEVQREFGSFDAYLWRYVAGRPLVNRWENVSEIPSKSALSEELSKDLLRRGFRFVGPTILYAYLQAVGVVNDHLVACFRHPEFSGSEGVRK
jgi:DNA-3-methyladenine glycosylase I